jgi:hypothetical protein
MFPRVSSHSLYHGLRAQLRTTRRRLRHASWNIARSDRRRRLDLRRTAAVNTFLHALEPSKARKSYSPPSRREGVPRSAATRMGRFSGQLVGGAGK